MRIEYHADDYGLFPSLTTSMNEQIKCKEINGISLMPNGLYNIRSENDCLNMASEQIQYCVHLDLFEGQCCSDAVEIDFLADKYGYLTSSFGSLLLYSFLPRSSEKRAKIISQLKTELHAQIEKCVEIYPGFKRSLRIDSHAHYHVIPIVFEALTELLDESGYNIEYIRMPKDEIKYYTGIYIPLINLIKAFVLNTLIKYDIHRLKATHNTNILNICMASMENRSFFGVLLSGRMAYSSVKLLIERAERSGKGEIELLFHPGDKLVFDEISSLTDKNDRVFWSNKNRNMEFRTLERFIKRKSTTETINRK